MPLGDFLGLAQGRGFLPLSFFVHRLAQIITDFLISKDIVIITDYYHQSIIINQSNQSLRLLICVNLCQSVVYERTGAKK